MAVKKTSKVSQSPCKQRLLFCCCCFSTLNIYVRIEKQGPYPPCSPFQLLNLLLLSHAKHSVYLGFTSYRYTVHVATIYLIISYFILKKLALFHVPPLY